MIRHDRLRELDLLRFLAAMGVVLFHFTGFKGAGPWPEPSLELFPGVGAVTRYGYLGVDLFFMISGFVILMSAWGRSPGEFGVSRVVRLMPAYWAGVLLGLVVYLGFRLGNGVPGLVMPNLTMLQAGLGLKNVDPVFWTLWVELHFYVLIAVLAAIKISYRSCLVFMAGWTLAGVFADEADNKLLQVMLMPTWSPYFVAGMALFLMYRFGPTLLLWGFVGVSWLLAMHWSAWRTGHVFTTADENVVAVVVTLIFVVMILVATGRLRRLRWRGLTVLGALTYPLYLTHSQVALPLLEHAYPGLNRWAALALATAVSLAVAYAVYRLVEKPGQKWMRAKLRESLAPIRAGDRGSGRASGDEDGKGRDKAAVPPPRPPGVPGDAAADGSPPELVRP
ncbi:acyltransferase [Actinomadura vinacea]|uniref:Acyltransferase n=1 Tax=Actinomadura vinacea TaxID=115336 RepID=A0ABN3J2B3_9ACTN